MCISRRAITSRSETAISAVGPPLVYADQAFSIVKRKYVYSVVSTTPLPYTHVRVETQLVLGVPPECLTDPGEGYSHSTKLCSRDVCAILLIANIMRCFFWLGSRFDLGASVITRGFTILTAHELLALLVQSLLMILAQLALLFICIHYRPTTSPESHGGVSSRPFGFWQWPLYSQVSKPS